VWLRKLFSELTHENTSVVPETAVIALDNQGASALPKNPGNHARSKHIEIRDHFVRGMVGAGNMEVTFVPVDEMVADERTKPPSKEKFRSFRGDRGLLTCPLDNGLGVTCIENECSLVRGQGIMGQWEYWNSESTVPRNPVRKGQESRNQTHKARGGYRAGSQPGSPK
jgi:hypothetical protein